MFCHAPQHLRQMPELPLNVCVRRTGLSANSTVNPSEAILETQERDDALGSPYWGVVQVRAVGSRAQTFIQEIKPCSSDV